MTQWKKLLTGILTTATVFSMTGAPIYAADGAGESTPITELTIQKEFYSVIMNENGEKVKNENGVLPSEDFLFDMTPDKTVKVTQDDKGNNVYETDSTNHLPIKPGIDLGENKEIDIAYDSTTENALQEESFDLSDVTFEGPAIYRYVVEEVEGSNTNIDYDSTKFTVDVMVDADGEIAAILDASTNKTFKNPIKFENTCLSDYLIIDKTVEGKLGDKKQQFTFTLDIPEEGNGEENGGITLESTTINGIITRANGKTETVTINIGDKKTTFTLADGESLRIDNLPAGMIYTVIETAVDGYTTDIKATTESGDESRTKNLKNTTGFNAKKDTLDGLSGSDMPIVQGGNIVHFTNTKDSTASTGILLDVAPYLAVLLIVAAGTVVIAVSKKRTQR